jgi:uncharacterized membrane protein YkgB
MITKEFKIIGGFGYLLLMICYLSIIGSAIAITEYDSKAITPVFNNESYFSFYNDDSQTYQVYIYNHTGNNSSCDGIIGRVEPHQSIYLPKNASYYLYCEYPDSLKLESIEEVKQGVNQYWVIVVVLIVIIVALYTAIRIVRGRRY